MTRRPMHVTDRGPQVLGRSGRFSLSASDIELKLFDSREVSLYSLRHATMAQTLRASVSGAYKSLSSY